MSAMGGRRALRRVTSYALRDGGSLALLVAMTCASSLLDLALPYVTGIKLLDRVIQGRRLGELPVVAGALVAIFVGQKLADGASDFLQVRVSQHLVHRLRCEVFEHVERLPVSFFDRTQTGEVLARITGDIDAIEGLASNVLPSLASQVVSLGGAGVFFYASGHALTLFVLPTVVGLVLSVVLFKGRVRTYARRVRDAGGEMSARAAEAISGVRTVKAFGAESIEAARFERASERVFAARLKSILPQALFTTAVDGCVLAGTLLVVVVGTHQIVAGTLTVGALVTSLAYLNRIYGEAKKASRMNIPIQRILVAADRVFELLDRPIEDRVAVTHAGDANGRKGIAATAARIQFQDVSFAYVTSRPVVRRLQLDIAPGEVLAFVGPSGSGKTTVVNLLLRFYQPDSGRVLLDGVPIAELPLAELRAQIGVVSQDALLFSGSVRENIAYGNAAATDEQVVRAARAAFAHDFVVQMPGGYEAPVGERGTLLSGGQRQRIAIARALLREPRILIFDEATSNLDASSERFVQRAIRTIARGRTVIVIAHRLSIASWADRIAVIDDGAIVEIGSHEALLRERGVYSRLSAIQLSSQPVEP
jgi:subfamily B ATP-binding cassette protein MsbA